MDKKRRKIKPTSTKTKHKALSSLCRPVSSLNHCGITYNSFEFLDHIGLGFYENYIFDELDVSITDVLLKQELAVDILHQENVLELSFLIEGEQIVKIDGLKNDFVCESQECYLAYLTHEKGYVFYHKNKRVKEIKIRMGLDFINKYGLNETYNILDKYSILKLKHTFLKPLCARTQDILSEILTDKRQGLLKRLFLESKILELITLQLESSISLKAEPTSQTDHLIKKLYLVQHLINTDLSIQYSIHQLSLLVGVNDFTLKKEFKRVFGKTIFEYAISLRMNKAKQLLLHSNKPIYEISEIVGYKNATHFTAAFKKVTGTTPKLFRNNTTGFKGIGNKKAP